MFLTVKLARTGSEYFNNVLKSHKDISSEFEILNPVRKEGTETKLSYFTEFFTKHLSESANGSSQLVGASLNPVKYRLTPQAMKRAIAAIPAELRGSEAPKILLLLRKNKLKQATSTYLALERGNWYSNANKFNEAKGKKNNANDGSKKSFDLWKLQWITIKYCLMSWYLFPFSKYISSNYMTVYYEDLEQNPEETFRKVFDFLGVDPVDDDFDFTCGYKKVGTKDLQDKIANYENMRFYPVLNAFMD